MTKKSPTPAALRFNISKQTLQVAHEAIVAVTKPNAQSMFNCAQALAEIEAVLVALPPDNPPPVAEADAAVEPKVAKKAKHH